MSDYVETYNDFWREIVEHPDGTLNRDQVMRELYDYRVAMREVSLAYDDVTNGRVSKHNTAARHVVAAVQERIEAAIKADREEIADEIEAECIDPDWPDDDISRNGRKAARIARGES